jgi:hypothetical protein
MIILFLIILILPFIQAQVNPSITSNPVYEQGKETTIPLPCTSNGNYCSANATCRTTIINPENTVLVNNYLMTKNDAVFEVNLSANQTEVNGEYQFNVVCADNGRSVSRFLKFYITPNGELPDTAKGIIYIGLLAVLFILFIIMIISGVNNEFVPIKTFMFLFAYIIFIGITFIAWNLSLDYLTSSPFLVSIFKWAFYVSLFALVPTILLSFIYMFYMIYQIKAIQNMLERGVPNDEAYEREVKGGLKGIFKGGRR